MQQRTYRASPDHPVGPESEKGSDKTGSLHGPGASEGVSRGQDWDSRSRLAVSPGVQPAGCNECPERVRHTGLSELLGEFHAEKMGRLFAARHREEGTDTLCRLGQGRGGTRDRRSRSCSGKAARGHGSGSTLFLLESQKLSTPLGIRSLNFCADLADAEPTSALPFLARCLRLAK